MLELLQALPTVEDVPSLAEVALGPLMRLTRARAVILFVPSPLGRLDVAGRAGEGALLKLGGLADEAVAPIASLPIAPPAPARSPGWGRPWAAPTPT